MAATFRKVGLSLALFPAPPQCFYVHSFCHLQNFQAENLWGGLDYPGNWLGKQVNWMSC